MKEYFMSVLTVSVVTAVASAVFSGTGSEKYVRYICAVIASAVILSPLLKLAGADIASELELKSETVDKSKGEEMMYSFLRSEGEKALEEKISELIFVTFGIKPLSVSILIEYTEDGCRINGGEIDLGGTGDVLKVSEFLSKNVGAAKWKIS